MMSIDSAFGRSWIDGPRRRDEGWGGDDPGTQPVELRGLIVQAIAAAHKGNRGEARSLFLEASQLEPGNETVWLWLAHLAEASRDRGYYFRQALRSNPRQEQARAGLAALLLEEGIASARGGAREVARRRLEELVEIDPRSESGWIWLASVGADRADQKRCLQRVLELNPNHAQARALLQRPEFREPAPAIGWRCPMCSFRAAQGPEVCPGCGLVLSLVDAERILTNSRLNRPLVEAGARRWQQLLATAPTFEAHLHLGLAHLNLRSSARRSRSSTSGGRGWRPAGRRKRRC
jgi:tetratricopeptide (TPR) repeat protein